MVVSNRLVSGESLHRGQHIISSDQHFMLVHQYDGNVVLYDVTGSGSGEPLWSTNTYGSHTTVFKMQEDSNLVLYATGGKAIWASDTHGSGGRFLEMQNDGNLVVYTDVGKPKWASNTHQEITPRSEFSVNQVLRIREELHSANKRNELILQNDGNLVLTKNGSTAWSSGTHGTGANVLVLQIDGNLVLYNDTKSVWASGSMNKGGRTVVMQDDGNLVLYAEGGRPVWATNT